MVPQEVRRCSKSVQIMASPMIEDEIPPAFMLDPAEIVLFM